MDIFTTAIQHFSQLKVIVIGELILDVFLYGGASQICREAPVPVVNVHTRKNVPGGAANAGVNLAALGANVTVLSVIGDDREAAIMTGLLKAQGVNTDVLLCDPIRETLAKKRIVSDDQMIVRYDHGSSEPLSTSTEKKFIQRLRKHYFSADVVLISDYACGLFTERVIAALKALRQQSPHLLVVDSRTPARFRELQPTLVKPNYQEALALIGAEKKLRRAEQIAAHQEQILQATGASITAVTLDRDGAMILEPGKPPHRTHTRPVVNSKAVGAGDTYVSAFALALGVGLSVEEAATLASAAAEIVVRKTGTATCSAEELVALFAPADQATPKIITDRNALAEQIEAYREQGRRIVFTNGCFDILHRGHVIFLKDAKTFGDVLVVGINSDQSVRHLKGSERPLNPLEDRMHVLAALDSVDHIISFDETTSTELLKIVKPDVFVKGGNYTKASLPEARIVEALGGKVEMLPYIVDRSTTLMMEKIRYRLIK
jgi:D-beta-D-heptose 7-phosphate kinase / D-beta-D-heptose 1-phosphate adenosyltransferase